MNAFFFIRGEVEFWERDSASDNDFLVGFTVHRNQISKGEMTAQLSGDDSTTRLLSKLWRMKRINSPGFRVRMEAADPWGRQVMPT